MHGAPHRPGRACLEISSARVDVRTLVALVERIQPRTRFSRLPTHADVHARGGTHPALVVDTATHEPAEVIDLAGDRWAGSEVGAAVVEPRATEMSRDRGPPRSGDPIPQLDPATGLAVSDR